MGSWNKTCGLSNLHIYSGDEVLVFVLEQGRDSASRCYATAFFSPVLLPFYSKYNDYGGGEESHGVGLELLLQGLRDNLVEKEVGDNEYHDIAVSAEKFGEQEFFDSVHESRLFVKDRTFGGGERSIDFVMFRKDIVDHILANLQLDHYVGNGKGTGGWDNNYIQYRFADVVADIPAFLSAMKTELSTSSATDVMFRRMGRSLDWVFEWGHLNKASWYVRNDTYRYSHLVPISDTITSLVAAGKMEEAAELLHDHILAQFLDEYMHMIRKVWIPGAHEGSQSSDLVGYEALIGAMSAAISEEKKRYDEDHVD